MSGWVAFPLPRRNARLRLFCLPYAGGGASVFRVWTSALPASIELCLIQLPGREHRISEPTFTRLPSLVEALTAALDPYIDRPFALFGHSMGALISFELARVLSARAGRGPVHLLVSGHRAPQLPATEPPVHQLPETALMEHLGRLRGTPVDALEQPELMQLVLPTVRADFELCETYVYRPGRPLDCSISAFGGSDDREVRGAAIVAWRDQTRASFIFRMLPGNHFFVHSARTRLLQGVVDDLQPYVRRSEAGPQHVLD